MATGGRDTGRKRRPEGRRDLAITRSGDPSLAQCGPLSWQQAARLRNERGHGRYNCIWNLFEIPDAVSDDEFRSRLAAMTDREDALRITNASLDDDCTVYAPAAAAPLSVERCDSFDDMIALASAKAREQFHRDARPLWAVTVIEHPDGRGRRVRHACTVFDHLVADGRSMHLVQRELIGGETAGGGRGRYREWVSWQNREFPRSGSVSGSLTRGFWLRHLDGTPADRATPLPFATEHPAPRDLITVLNARAPVSSDAVRRVTRRLRTSPFVLVLAAVASLVAAGTGESDLTMRVISSGRPPKFANTLGWFADSLPIRLRDPLLRDPQRTVTVAGAAWSDILRSHYVAPWGYVHDVCRPGGSAAAEFDRRQLVINFFPHDLGGMFSPDIPEKTAPGDIDGIHLLIWPRFDDCFGLRFLFNPDHFAIEGVRSFLHRLARQLTELTEGTADVRSGDQART